MKKLFCMMMALICLAGMISFAGADGSSEWPEISLYGYGTTLKPSKDESRRYQSTFGPGKNYPGAGAYKPYKVTSATALMREGDYVLVDMSYKTVGRRILYFKDTSLTNSAVESVYLQAYPAVTTTTIQPLFGPGYAYDKVTMTVQGKQDKKSVDITIGAGNRVSVFFEVNGWVFAEFNCSLGLIRAWLPADRVE